MSKELTKNVANNVANTNSQHLTEQWRNGTLDGGWYFLEFENGSTLPVYYCGFNREFEFGWDWKISKVLAPVPSFADLCELKQELEICKEEKADLYAKLCNALMQLESKNNQFVELTEKVEQLEKDNKYLKSGIETRDKQIEQLVKQLKEANKIIKKLYKESGNPIGCDYLEKWGAK